MSQVLNPPKDLKFRWMPKPIIVLVSGKAGVGKTTFSDYMVTHAKNIGMIYSSKNSFANGIKNIATAMGWTGYKDEKGRRLLQDLGRIGREYNENIWAENLMDSIEVFNLVSPDLVVVDDWRFPSEGNFVDRNKYSVYKVRILAPDRESLKGTEHYNDISENSLPEGGNYYDYVVDNNKITLKELSLISIEILNEIRELELGG